MSERVESLTHLGLGRTSSGDLVPRVLPGELIERADKGSIRILEPSPDRVAAPCHHYKACGGCSMQQASDAFVAAWKQSIVERALAAHDLSASFCGPQTSPVESRRRARFSGRRTKKGALVGFHAKASDQITEVSDCIVVTPALRRCLPVLEELTVLAASRRSEVSFTVTESIVGLDILIETEQPLTPALRLELAAQAQRNKIARLTWNDETVVTMTAPHQSFGTVSVIPPPGAFLQATQDGEDALTHAVRRICAKAAFVVDLFAGCGTFALPLSETARVDAFEGSEEMIAALEAGWRKSTGLKPVKAVARDLFRRPIEVDELAAYDAAVIDPPRAGALAQIERLASSDIKTIAMVSCNPVTFARDAAILVQSGFEMGPVQVVDQFRWSTHVEVVTPFTKA